MSEQCLTVWVFFLFFLQGEHAQKPKFGDSVKKKLHKALRSVQFLASFISFYFEILSYLACGEKIIRLASRNSVKLNEKPGIEEKGYEWLSTIYCNNSFMHSGDILGTVHYLNWVTRFTLNIFRLGLTCNNQLL